MFKVPLAHFLLVKYLLIVIQPGNRFFTKQTIFNLNLIDNFLKHFYVSKFTFEQVALLSYYRLEICV